MTDQAHSKEDKPVIIITGACGLIGSALSERLSAKNRVVGFDIRDEPGDAPLAKYYKVDLTSDEGPKEGVEKVRESFGDRIASVIHLAAYYDFSGEPSPLYEELTIKGTGRLLSSLQSLQVEQFVFSSTLLVHAPAEIGKKIDENWPLEPKWEYPQSKKDAEALIRKEHGDIPVVLARLAGVYSDQCDSIPIAHQIQRIYERQMTGKVYPGDLDKGQPFLHIEDLVDAFEKMVDRRADLPPELTVNIGEDKTFGYGEIQKRLGRLIHDEEWETRKVPKPIAKTGAWVEEQVPGHDPFIKPWMVDLTEDHMELDISCAKNQLGWEPRHDLLDTFPQIVEYLKADPVDFYKHNKLEMPGKIEKAADS
ncbi:MAG TPA: NAD(P)-dependent oxidoreductase [Opitutales bacterium]|nr:NAD(P)-dependent oxidoreductase [Opitutales bacterium]